MELFEERVGVQERRDGVPDERLDLHHLRRVVAPHVGDARSVWGPDRRLVGARLVGEAGGHAAIEVGDPDVGRVCRLESLERDAPVVRRQRPDSVGPGCERDGRDLTTGEVDPRHPLVRYLERGVDDRACAGGRGDQTTRVPRGRDEIAQRHRLIAQSHGLCVEPLRDQLAVVCEQQVAGRRPGDAGACRQQQLALR